MTRNEKHGPLISGYASHTHMSDPARGVRYIDSRKHFLVNAVKQNANAAFLMTFAEPSWRAAKAVCEIVQDDHVALQGIASDRHMVQWVYNNMSARRALKGN